jgi:hypothetical protein
MSLLCCSLSLAAQTQKPGTANPPGSKPAQTNSNNYPWNRDLMIRWSADGQTFESESVFTETAGVPSITKDEKGTLAAAFQWFPLDRADAFDKVAVRFSTTGGISWTDPAAIEVKGLPASYQRPFDPTIVNIPGKGYRMYFSCGPRPAPTGPRPMNPSSDVNVATYSAFSTDGVHYEFEPGARFEFTGHRVIDCAVAFDGTRWQYIAPIGRPDEGAYSATSSDGLAFTRLTNITSSGSFNWTGNLVALGSQLRFYGASREGVWWSQRSANNQWSAPVITNFRGGDPAVAQGKDGKLFIVYVSESRRNVSPPNRMR